MSQAFVFPGQGSQTVGMGLDLVDAYPAARGIFQEVDDALGMSLSRLMFEGPEDQLILTENAQPAILTHGIAIVRVVEERFGTLLTEQADFMAGHSLGEYTALTAAGALPLTDAVRLVRARGQAIQNAVPVGTGAMAAIIGLTYDDVWEIAREATSDTEVCQIANDNAPDELVVSGHRAAVERAMTSARDRGAEKVVLLPVSAAFHCDLLSPAAEAVDRLLGEIEIAPPRVPVIANATATPLDNPDAIHRRLVEQLTEMVRWRETVEFLRDQGIGRLVELGAGQALTRLARRIDDSFEAHALVEPRDIEAYFGNLADEVGETEE